MKKWIRKIKMDKKNYFVDDKKLSINIKYLILSYL